jgi:hypothetical protein
LLLPNLELKPRTLPLRQPQNPPIRQRKNAAVAVVEVAAIAARAKLPRVL